MQKITQTQIPEILLSHKSAIIKITSIGCAPCLVVGNILDKLEKEPAYQQAVFFELPAQSNTQFCMDNNVKAAPTLLFYKDCVLTDRLIGFKTEREIREKIDAIL